MINWYYVQGSERVGPVNEETLRDLFNKAVLNAESYVWKKGMANWEHLKDVSELDFSQPAEPAKAARQVEPAPVKTESKPKVSESSPEVTFNFDWDIVRSNEELFFIKIGHDRRHLEGKNLYGPYSLNELKEAMDDKRVNDHTLIFAAGMPGWVEIGQTPLNPKNLKLDTKNVLDETPLLIVVNNDHLPLITLVFEAGTTKCTLLGAGPFKSGSTVLGSIYSGTALKAKNVKMTIDEYRPHEQKVFCSINDIDDSAKMIMQNYAN
ncbi:MAG: DUF4339 domain-containing protein [Bacteriovorax sp.]|jgi:hypothetical protein